MRIFILDNYDSFTFNLYHLVDKITDCEIIIRRNDEISVENLEGFDKIILSPGPGLPQNAGCLMEVIRTFSGKIPILGVCLGQQAIAEVYGGELINLEKVLHGVSSPVNILDPGPLFKDLPRVIDVAHYHSWVVNKNNFPDCLKILAEDSQGNIMSLAHKEFNICGVQFHPESILTPEGETIMRNWLFHSDSE